MNSYMIFPLALLAAVPKPVRIACRLIAECRSGERVSPGPFFA